MYHLNGKEHALQVRPYSLVRIPQNTYHTIYNHTNTVSLNMSIKVPKALKDRLEDSPNSLPGDGVAEILEPKTVSENELLWSLSHHKVDYNIRLYRFENEIEIRPLRYGLVYCISGEAVAQMSSRQQHLQGVLRPGDILVLDDDTKVYIKALQAPVVLYRVSTDV